MESKILTTDGFLREVVKDALAEAMREMRKEFELNYEQFYTEKEALSYLDIKDYRTLRRYCKQTSTEVYSKSSKKIYKKHDIHSLYTRLSYCLNNKG